MLRSNNKYFYIFCFVLIEFCLSINVNAQNYKDPSIGISNRVYVQYTDSLIETFCYRGDKKIKTHDDLFYYWHAAQDIKRTRGGYEGKILHGSYTAFYYNKDLLSKGNFKYGLKQGLWKSWYSGGELKSKETWKKGVMVGKAYYYNNKGIIQKESNIKPIVGNGYVKLYNDNGILMSKKFYKKNLLDREVTYQINEKGKLVQVKPVKTEPEKQKKFFKKKISDSKSKEKKSKEKKIKEKKVKEKKQKIPKVKIQKYRGIVPGGEGA